MCFDSERFIHTRCRHCEETYEEIQATGHHSPSGVTCIITPLLC